MASVTQLIGLRPYNCIVISPLLTPLDGLSVDKNAPPGSIDPYRGTIGASPGPTGPARRAREPGPAYHPACPTVSPVRPARTSFSTPTTRSTGILGCGGARPREAPTADLPLHRLCGLPLVPRHGARVVRGRGHGRRPQRHFVSIKVDREERPDLDAVYMDAVQAMTGGGGWPMCVFLTPDGRPFYGGTYFPNEPRHGMPAFLQVLAGVAGRGGSSAARSKAPGSAWSRRSSPEPRGRRRGGPDPRPARRARPGSASFDARNGGWGARRSSRSR